MQSLIINQGNTRHFQSKHALAFIHTAFTNRSTIPQKVRSTLSSLIINHTIQTKLQDVHDFIDPSFVLFEYTIPEQNVLVICRDSEMVCFIAESYNLKLFAVYSGNLLYNMLSFFSNRNIISPPLQTAAGSNHVKEVFFLARSLPVMCYYL